jgi:predicted O-linked N-acetylglucosamine transferase (SPINDLY family)
LELISQGRFAEAANLAQDMTLRFPQHGGSWKVLGVALQNIGRNLDALLPMQKAAELSPYDAEVHNNLGSTYLGLGKLYEAVASYTLALKIAPNYVSALCNMGAAQQKMGLLVEAESNYKKALLINPGYARAHNNLGAIFQDSGKLDKAEECYLRALELEANNAESYYNLSITLKDLGRLDEAELMCRRSLLINSDYAEAYNHLGVVLNSLGNFEEAEHSYRKAILIKPHFADAYNNLGHTLHGLNRFKEAVEICQQAIQIDPNLAEAHNNLGNSLKILGRLEEAEACCARALQINPNLAEALSNEGSRLLDLGRLHEAEDFFRRAIRAKPSFFDAHSNLLFGLSQDSTLDALTLFSEHCLFGKQAETPFLTSTPSHTNSRIPERCLQIGFVSGDLCGHAISSFIEPLLEHLSGYSQLSLHAYYNHNLDDSTTQRLRGYFAHWNMIFGMPDDALAEKIRTDHIDILIDLSGHTAKNRLLTFARKPAPVQVSWMGYPGTTGMSTMDYYLSDRFILPPGLLDNQFSEKIARLPANAPFLPSTHAPLVNQLPALSNGYVTFGSFNRLFKLSREVIALWCQLLRALPESRLVLGGMPEDKKYEMLTEWFTQEGIAMERLDFHPRSNMENYLQLHQRVDICLDTFPYNGGTTTMHALWMGVPTLTLAGCTVAGRTGAGVLGHVGLDEFIAHNSTEFVQKGLFWADNLVALSDIRAGLRERFAKSAVGQPELIAAGLERALRSMWQRWCANLPAESFEVTKQESIGAMKGAGK